MLKSLEQTKAFQNNSALSLPTPPSPPRMILLPLFNGIVKEVGEGQNMVVSHQIYMTFGNLFEKQRQGADGVNFSVTLHQPGRMFAFIQCHDGHTMTTVPG